MSADRNENRARDRERDRERDRGGNAGEGGGRFSGRVRATGNRPAEPANGLRDAIAFLNRDSVALPPPESPAWQQQQPARPALPGVGAGQQPGPYPGQPGLPGGAQQLGQSGQHQAQHQRRPETLAPVRELRPGAPPGHALPPPQADQRIAGLPGPSANPGMPGPGMPGAAGGGQHTAGLNQGMNPGQPYPPQRETALARRPGNDSFGPRPDTGINAFAEIDWPSVEAIRKQVRDRITEQFPHRDSGSEAQRRAFGMAVIEEAVNSWYARSISRGLALNEAQQQTMRRAVGASVFGMGRLTPMLDHPDIENIEYRGCDDGYVVYSDGRVEKAPPIADSDETLLADLQYWAAKQNRVLSYSTPHLYLTLEGGARLTATIGTSKRPNLVIRRHRVVDVTLDDLVGRGMISPSIAAFLRAAVLANCNIVVTGPLNSGKTTLLRALASEIPPMERYATLETEYELHLDEVGRHPRMVAYQALLGTAERGANGRRAGEITLTDIMEVALRMNFTRLIVGEIRGAEVVAMLEAVSTGGRGSLCTMHANSARDVFGRFVTLCTRTNMTRDSAVQLAAESLHYIVNVQMDSDSAAGYQNNRTARRFVDQIVEVNGTGDGINPAATDVFAPGVDGRAVFAHRPERLVKLQKAGFDPNWLLYGNDQWNITGASARQESARQSPAQNAHRTVASPFSGTTFSGTQNTAGTGTVTAEGQDRFDRQYLQDRQRLDRMADGRPNPDADPRGGGRGHR